MSSFDPTTSSSKYKHRVRDFFRRHFHHIDWAPYRPLIIMVSIVLLTSVALKIDDFLSWIGEIFTREDTGITGAALAQDFMHAFMGLMFMQFGMLKLFDLEGFVQGFKKYDLFAQSSDTYARAYPFIEISLGFAYLSYFLAPLTYAVTMIVMAISGYSVLIAVRRGIDAECACLGTILKVPLSTVSLIENLGMGLMATFMLLATIY